MRRPRKPRVRPNAISIRTWRTPQEWMDADRCEYPCSQSRGYARKCSSLVKENDDAIEMSHKPLMRKTPEIIHFPMRVFRFVTAIAFPFSRHGPHRHPSRRNPATAMRAKPLPHRYLVPVDLARRDHERGEDREQQARAQHQCVVLRHQQAVERGVQQAEHRGEA